MQCSVTALRRYPVKSMGGEDLGVAVFGYAAHTGPGGRVTVVRGDERWQVGDPLLDQRLSGEMGAPVRVTPEADAPHQDMGALSIVGTASLQWCAERWGGSPDPRRLRVNIVVESDEPFAEERWAEIELGTTRLRVAERIPRCRMIDIAQDGAEPGERWLRSLGRERDLCLAVYADVVRPGHITLGDRVRATGACELVRQGLSRLGERIAHRSVGECHDAPVEATKASTAASSVG